MNELEIWYEKSLNGQSSDLIGDKILQKLANEIKIEFPSTSPEFANFFKERKYDKISNVDFD